jgi:hypothetical protein
VDSAAASAKDELDIDSAELIAGLAALLQGTVERLDETAGRVTNFLASRTDRLDREMVVALQDFDRIQQEFAALSRAFTRSVTPLREASSAGIDLPRARQDAMDAIAVSNLRDRLAKHLERDLNRRASADADSEEMPASDIEKVF